MTDETQTDVAEQVEIDPADQKKLEKLAAIVAMNRQAQKAHMDFLEANDVQKGLKKKWEAMVIDLQAMIAEQPKLPFEDTPAETEDSAPTGWQEMPLADLGLKPQTLKALTENETSLTTMGQLCSFQVDRGDFWGKDIAGCGPEMRTEIDNAVEEFMMERAKAQDEEAGEGSGEPEFDPK